MMRTSVTFTATDPCARISDYELESTWWKMLGKADIDVWGLEMTCNRDFEREERLIRRASGLVVACSTAEGLIAGISPVVMEQIDLANNNSKVIYTEAPLEDCLNAGRESILEPEYRAASVILSAAHQVVIGTDVSIIRNELGVR